MSKNIVVATSAVLLSVLLVTVLAGAERPAQPGMAPPHMEAFKRAWFEHQSGSVLARGTVVDSEGKALTGVKLTVREDRETRLGGRTKSVSLYSQLDTASFEAKAAGVSGLDLLFTCEGYFAERVYLKTTDALPKDWEQRLIDGKDVPLPSLVREGMRIMMESHGPLANLREVTVPLKFSSAGPCAIWNLAYTDPRAEKEVAGVRDESALPTACIYLQPALDEHGSIDAQEIRDGAGTLLPRSLKLVMKGEGGFIPVLTTKAKEGRQFRSMAEAPDKGYTRDLVLEARSVQEYASSDVLPKDSFFYFKAGKLYGKGRIAYLELRNDCVKAGLILRFDETGSRNLATEH